MAIEHLIRYAPRAVGLKPSAIRGEARLRGLYRNNSSKTISPRLGKAKPACAGYTGLFIQRPSFRSPHGERDSGSVQPLWELLHAGETPAHPGCTRRRTVPGTGRPHM